MRTNPTAREFATPDVLRVAELLATNRASILPLLAGAALGSAVASTGDAAARSESGHSGPAALPLSGRSATHAIGASRQSKPDSDDPAAGCSNMLGLTAFYTSLATSCATIAITRSHADCTGPWTLWRLQCHTTTSTACMRTCH